MMWSYLSIVICLFISTTFSSSGYRNDKGRSIARQWNEYQTLNIISKGRLFPTVEARNLFHGAAVMYDSWSAYQQGTKNYIHKEKVSDWRNKPTDTMESNIRKTISYAMYNFLSHRYKIEQSIPNLMENLKEFMKSLGYSPYYSDATREDPASLGIRIADTYIAYGLTDGSNEQNDYVTTIDYTPVNPPLRVFTDEITLIDNNRWQPLYFDYTTANNTIKTVHQTFLTPHWSLVTPFGLTDADNTHSTYPPVYLDQGLPTLYPDPEYFSSWNNLIELSSYLDANDGVMIDTSPAKMGNNRLGQTDGNGWQFNPYTGKPYPPNKVKRGDFSRVVPYFWAEGPNKESTTGIWNTIFNYVSDSPYIKKRIGGKGPIVSDLEWDIKGYLVVNGAQHDAGIVVRSHKRPYDTIRPISAIRGMCKAGQSSDPNLPNYNPSGIKLREGLVELITESSSSKGNRHYLLKDKYGNRHIGEIALYAWKGHIPEPPQATSGKYASGAGWILCSDWIPYQLANFVTPAFPGYISGHSTYGRAAAEALALFTGDYFFPGGVGLFRAPARTFLTEIESGPSEDHLLVWATYYDASDQEGISRQLGGVHPLFDDLPGRLAGDQCGKKAWYKALTLWNPSY